MADLITIATVTAKAIDGLSKLFPGDDGGGGGETGELSPELQLKIRHQQQQVIRDLQKRLNLRFDDAISDIQASSLKQRGIIDDSTEKVINQLNDTGLDFQESINNLTDQVFTDEQSIMKSIVNAGVFTRDELNQGALDSFSKSQGFTDKAIESLSPFSKAGKTALRSLQFRTGLLTPEEETQFRADFEIPEGEAPQSSVAKAAEQAALRRLRAGGISQSGFALEDLAQTAAKVETEDLNRLERLSGAGQSAATNISGLQSGRGKDVLGLQERLSQNLAKQRENESERTRLTQASAAQQRLGLGKEGAQAGLDINKQIGQQLDKQGQFQQQIEASSQGLQTGIGLTQAATELDLGREFKETVVPTDFVPPERTASLRRDPNQNALDPKFSTDPEVQRAENKRRIEEATDIALGKFNRSEDLT